MTPEKGGLELGKLCKLLEPALPYCREQVCSHEWEGEEEETRHRSVWNDKDGKADNEGRQRPGWGEFSSLVYSQQLLGWRLNGFLVPRV